MPKHRLLNSMRMALRLLERRDDGVLMPEELTAIRRVANDAGNIVKQAEYEARREAWRRQAA